MTLQQKKFAKYATIIGVIAVLGLVFQIAHFFEHLAQGLAWIFGSNKTELYMTPWATDLVMYFANWFPERSMAERHIVGMEILHFFGNLLFLIGLIAYQYFDRSRFSRIALITQSIHMFEHVLLTTSVVITGVPVGFTTLFGAPMSPATSSGIRGIAHFVLNLIPSWYIAKAVHIYFKKKKSV